MWLIDPSFPKVVNTTWIPDNNYFTCLYDFQKVARKWNSDHFGNIFTGKKILIKHLHGIHKALEHKFIPFLTNLQNDMYQDYLLLLKQRNSSGT